MNENNEFDEETKRMVYEIHGDVKKINKHLENLNNKVERHEEDINDLDEKTNNNSKKINMGVGVAIATSTLIGAAASFIGAV